MCPEKDCLLFPLDIMRSSMYIVTIVVSLLLLSDAPTSRDDPRSLGATVPVHLASQPNRISQGGKHGMLN